MAFLRQEARVVERFRIIEVAETESVTEAARRFSCSRTTVCKLIARYREGGLRALMNRPRGPREPISEEVVELVVELKASAPTAPAPRSSSCWRSATAFGFLARASGASCRPGAWPASWTQSPWCDSSDRNPISSGRWI